jgi:hypothetical protein
VNNDTLIIRETVERFISGYPFHLSDQTISRTFWAEGLIDERAKVMFKKIHILVDGVYDLVWVKRDKTYQMITITDLIFLLCNL